MPAETYDLGSAPPTQGILLDITSPIAKLSVTVGRLDPTDFKLTDSSDESNTFSFYITHTPTGSYFNARWAPNIHSYAYNRRLGTDPVEPVHSVDEWDVLLNLIPQWTKDVADWAEIPDLWEIRDGWRAFIDSGNEDTSNAPFTAEEQEAISGQLASIKESIKKTYDLTAGQEKKLDNRFDEFEKASRRLGRKDWILLFMGGIFSLILADAITPGIAEHILITAGHGLEHLFSGAPRSLPGGAQ